MSRKSIRTVANDPTEFICDSHKEYDRNASELKDRPIVFFGKKLNRDQQYAVMDMISLKDPEDSDKGVVGTGKGYKYMWKHLITEVHNVHEAGDVVKGHKKDELWYTEGMTAEISEAITHYYLLSSQTDEEVKTSD